MDLLIIIANFAAYAFLCWWLMRNHKSKIAIFIACIWVASSFFSVLFYAVFPSIYRPYEGISVVALIFLLVCFSINLYPLSRLKSPDQFHGNKELLFIFSMFIILLNIVPFFANIVYFLSHLGSVEDFGRNYGEEVEIFTGMAGSLNRYAGYLRVFPPLLFFYFARNFKHNFYLCAALALCCLNPILSNLNIGSRFTMVSDILYLMAVFIISQKSIHKSLRKLIAKAFVAVSIPLVVVFLAISIFKAQSSSVLQSMPLLTSFVLYGGESFLNFSTQMWNQCEPTMGDNSFYIIKHILGMYSDIHRDSDALTMASGVPANVFYTYIGDFYMDFGALVSFLLVLSFSALLLWLITRANRSFSIYFYFLIAFFIRVLISGFTYYQYLNNAYEIVYAPAVCVGLLIVDYYFGKSVKPSNERAVE